MRNRISYLVLLASVVLSLHLIGIFAGLYENHIRIDVIQHILAGVIFGTIWLWWLKPENINISKTLIFISTVSFVALGSVLWEVLEFATSSLLPSFASSFKFYSPTVGELLSDVASGLVGGVSVGMYAVLRKKVKFL